MGAALDLHTKSLKTIIKLHGRSVTLIEQDGTEHTGLIALWNDVEHVLKIDNFAGDPMGARDSLYFDRDSLNIAGIEPDATWTARGNPNDYVASMDYAIEIPKEDFQLPGILLFLSKIDSAAKAWTKPAE